MTCKGCKQNIEEVEQQHEKFGHNVQCSMRRDITGLSSADYCEDCVDDVLEDMQ